MFRTNWKWMHITLIVTALMMSQTGCTQNEANEIKADFKQLEVRLEQLEKNDVEKSNAVAELRVRLETVEKANVANAINVKRLSEELKLSNKSINCMIHEKVMEAFHEVAVTHLASQVGKASNPAQGLVVSHQLLNVIKLKEKLEHEHSDTPNNMRDWLNRWSEMLEKLHQSAGGVPGAGPGYSTPWDV